MGAGPSLDLCEQDILQFIKKNDTIFVLSDSVAQFFIDRFPQSKRVIITVEKRPHSYLKQLKNEHIFFYHGVRLDNLPKQNFLYPFYLSHESLTEIFSPASSSAPLLSRLSLSHEKFFHLVSPGTVGGLSLSLAFFLQLYHPQAKKHTEKKVTCMGLDFSYLDNRVFSRYAKIYFEANRFASREQYELIVVYQKTSELLFKFGQAIRSCAEFSLANKNCVQLIESLPPQVSVEDFSPLGIDSVRTKKRVPITLAVP